MTRLNREGMENLRRTEVGEAILKANPHLTGEKLRELIGAAEAEVDLSPENRRPKNYWEQKLLRAILALGLPRPKPQYKFHPKRRFKIDFAYPEIRLGLEVDGGGWTKIRRRDGTTSIGAGHSTPEGRKADADKLNQAAILDWTIMRFPTEVLMAPGGMSQSIHAIAAALRTRGAL